MATAAVNNGVNVQALLDAREALKGAPEAAKFTWRATCKWQNGTHSRSNVLGFFGLGQEQKHKTETSFDADHPEIFASEGEAAFRAQEALALAEAVSSDEPAVIGVAGGAVLDPDNRQRIRDGGLVVWLRADPDELARRVGNGAGRPLLGDDPQ